MSILGIGIQPLLHFPVSLPETDLLSIEFAVENPLIDQVTLGTMVVMAKSVPPEVAAPTDVVESLLKPFL